MVGCVGGCWECGREKREEDWEEQEEVEVVGVSSCLVGYVVEDVVKM